jgi:short-subunit dehydrogenase
MSAYTASKFAVVGLSDALRLELGDGPVGLSVVYPGMTNTRFAENSRRQIEAAGGAVMDESKGIGNIHELGMSPDKLAERVLNGVAAREYHIFTHADWKPSIQAVFDDRIAAFGENADPDYHEDIASLRARIAEMQAAQ